MKDASLHLESKTVNILIFFSVFRYDLSRLEFRGFFLSRIMHAAIRLFKASTPA